MKRVLARELWLESRLALSGLLVHVIDGDPLAGKVERELEEWLRDLRDD